jgi:hypothetical protein
MSLTMLVPTRGRPANVRRLLEACAETVTRKDTTIVIGVGEDDPDLDEYLDLFVIAENRWSREGVHRFDSMVFAELPADRAGCVEPLNQMYRWAKLASYPFTTVGFMGDDVLPETVGWDERLLEEVELGDRPTITYPNDGLRPDIPTAVVMDARIPAELGYLAPPEFRHLYIDVVWRDWGTALGSLVYREDIMLRHLHPAAGHGTMDASYQHSNSAEMVRHDGAAYETYQAEQLHRDIEKLRQLCES